MAVLLCLAFFRMTPRRLLACASIVMIGGSLGIEMEGVQRSLLALSHEVLPKLR